MANHHIILGGSYNAGTRMAIHTPFEGPIESEVVMPIVRMLIRELDGFVCPFGVHTTQTRSTDWESVVRSDGYFRDVRLVSPEEFVRLTRLDEHLTGRDVAEYIACEVPCTPRRLHLLTCICNLEYELGHGEPLFTDTVSYDDGVPEVPSVSAWMSGRTRPDGTVEPLLESMIWHSRFLAASNGTKRLSGVLDPLRDHGDEDEDTLVRTVAELRSQLSSRG